MFSQSSWMRWRGKFFALFFIVQYHCRMLFLNLRYKKQKISRDEIDALALNYWRKLCAALDEHTPLAATIQTVKKGLEHESVTATLRVVKKGLEHESVTATLQVVKKGWEHEPFTATLQAVKKGMESEKVTSKLHIAREKLEQIIFIEEAPTQPIELNAVEKLRAAQQALAQSKTAQLSLAKIKAVRASIGHTNIAQQLAAQIATTSGPILTTRLTPRKQKITLITTGAVALLLVVLFAQSSLKLSSQTMQTFKTLSISAARQFGVSELNIISHQQSANINASQTLARISQLDLSEYHSHSEYDTWAYSACSTASLTEVFNAYGHHYKIADVLKVESAIGAITPDLGLTSNAGIAETAAKFGFQTNWGDDWTLDQVLSNANAGHPVIVGWPPSRYDGGHIVVVVGGDAHNVYLADSSLWDRRAIPQAQFMQWWAGFAAVVTPE